VIVYSIVSGLTVYIEWSSTILCQ